MLCQDPFVKGAQAFPCGRCLPCLKRRKQLWMHRLMLEKLCHADSAFATLTYAPEFLPSDMSLDPAILQRFLKRLRRATEPAPLRFYGIGEYGDQSQRPHYHVLLFGFRTCLRGRSMYDNKRKSCCSQCDLVAKVWGQGHVLLGDVTEASVGYVCSYITKNMRRMDDHRLKGRLPEFARMSLRPGIGFGALDELSQVYMRYNLDKSEGDVATGLRHGKSLKPLGRYLRTKLRDMLGMSKEDFCDLEMSAMYEVAKMVTPSGGDVRKYAFKNALIDAGAQKVLNMQAKDRIFRQRRTL